MIYAKSYFKWNLDNACKDIKNIAISNFVLFNSLLYFSYFVVLFYLKIVEGTSGTAQATNKGNECPDV